MVSRIWAWVKPMGVVSGCGCNEVYRFPHNFYLFLYTPLISALFCSSIPTFCSFKKMFSLLFQSTFCNLCHNSFVHYKHTNQRLLVSQGSHYEGLHIMFYTQRSTHKRMLHILRWTSAVCLQGAGCSLSRSRSRGRTLYRDASRAAYMLGRHASFKGRRSRTKGRSQCVLVKICHSTWNTYLV